MTSEEVMDKACAILSQQCGLEIKVSQEDRFLVAIVEAMLWLEHHAPSRAYDALKDAHNSYLARLPTPTPAKLALACVDHPTPAKN